MPATNAPRVYGYIRWSTDRQTEGESLARQQERIDGYVERHGLTLHELSPVRPRVRDHYNAAAAD